MTTSATHYLLWFGSFPSVARALAKNGSYQAHLLPAINGGLCAATTAMLIHTGIPLLIPAKLWKAAELVGYIITNPIGFVICLMMNRYNSEIIPPALMVVAGVVFLAFRKSNPGQP